MNVRTMLVAMAGAGALLPLQALACVVEIQAIANVHDGLAMASIPRVAIHDTIAECNDSTIEYIEVARFTDAWPLP